MWRRSGRGGVNVEEVGGIRFSSSVDNVCREEFRGKVGDITWMRDGT